MASLKRIILFIFMLVSNMNTFGQTRLPAFFSDGMVLKRNYAVSIWGWDEKGVDIIVIASWGEAIKSKANNYGRWEARLNTPEVGNPQSISIQASQIRN